MKYFKYFYQIFFEFIFRPFQIFSHCLIYSIKLLKSKIFNIISKLNFIYLIITFALIKTKHLIFLRSFSFKESRDLSQTMQRGRYSTFFKSLSQNNTSKKHFLFFFTFTHRHNFFFVLYKSML